MYIKEEYTNEIIIEKSKFITYLNHCTSENEYKDYLTSIKKLHHNASHTSNAFILGNYQKTSDDGEPQGSAGLPILKALEYNKMDEICAIVVRYYGGVKLGIGGLTRAYSESVNECLKKSVKYKKELYKKYKLVLDYSLANKIDYFLRNNSVVLNTNYLEDVTYLFALNNDELLDKINEYTKGQKAIYLEETYIEKKVNDLK